MRRPANVFGGLVTCANAKAMDLGDAVHVNSGGRRRDERNFTAARFRRPLAVAVLLLTFAGGLPVRADIFLRPTTYITDNTNYERNASLVHDGADYWLFYMKADTGGVRGVAGYDPDSTRYTVYYRKSNTMAGLAGAPETELTESNATNGPPTLNQRNVSAAVLDGKTYAFVDSGVSGASGTKKLYYYKHDAGSWSNYEQLTGGSLSYGGHVNVCTAGDHIAIAWNGGETSDFFTFDGSTNDIGSTQVDIDGGIMPKIAKLGSDLYAVNIGKGGGWPIQLWKSDDDGQTWTGLGQVSDLAGWDPCIFAHQGELYVVNAPGVGSDGQKLVMACSLDGGATWSASEDLSTGGAGTEEWWDYWPIGFSVPSGPEQGAYAFFTTETDEGGSVLSDGEIALMQIAGAVVPEPAAAVVWLLGAGVVFCCAAMRRQKKTFDKTSTGGFSLMKRNTSLGAAKTAGQNPAIVAVIPLVLALAGLANAEYTFTDQTPTAPILAGDYQRYVTVLGDGTNLALWYENRTQGTIEMRTSAAGYSGFGSPQATTGLGGLSHPKIFSDGGTGYTGYFWDSAQSPPNGVRRLVSTDGLSWSGTTQITIANSPFPGSKIWGVQGCFENVSADTDVLYYTEGTGANEQLYRATATDGLTFTHQGTAFVNPCGPGLGIGVGAGSQVCYDPGTSQYLLLWCGESATDDIAYATSDDGVTFTQQASVILENSGHNDLEEVSFVLNGSELLGLYTADFAGASQNHIGAFTGSTSAPIPEPAAAMVWLLGGAVLLCCAAVHRRRRKG